MLDAAVTDRLRAVYEGFSRGDLDAVVAGMADDVVAIEPAQTPDADTFTGPEALRERLAGFIDLFEDIELADLRFEAVGDRVLVVFNAQGRARLSGAALDLEVAHLLRLRDGLVTEMRVFFGEAAAREYLATS